jgi:hypothetical protein
MTKKEKVEAKIEEKEGTIATIDRKTMVLHLEGISPLISHKFSEKKQAEILRKQMMTANKAPGKEAKDPQKDYEECLYVLPDGRFGFPLNGFKRAVVDAAAFTGKQFAKTFVRGAFQIIDTTNSGLAAIANTTPHMRKDVVRLNTASKSADIRYRAEFPIGWKISLTITYNTYAISAEQIAQLFELAGFSIGIGDWRPQTNGSYGMFRVARAEKPT